MNRNIVDLIMIDHGKIKECIHVLQDEDADGREKLRNAKEFLSIFPLHAKIKEQVLFERIKEVPKLTPLIVKGREDHAAVIVRIQEISPWLAGIHSLSEDLQIKLLDLGVVVQKQLQTEESDVLPVVRSLFKESELAKFGNEYLDERNFSEDDLDFIQSPGS